MGASRPDFSTVDLSERRLDRADPGFRPDAGFEFDVGELRTRGAAVGPAGYVLAGRCATEGAASSLANASGPRSLAGLKRLFSTV